MMTSVLSGRPLFSRQLFDEWISSAVSREPVRYKGMLPCFFLGVVSLLFSSIRRAAMIFGRV